MHYEILCHQTFAAFRIGKGIGWRTRETGQWGVDNEVGQQQDENSRGSAGWGRMDPDEFLYLIELDVAVHLSPPRTSSLFIQLHQSPS